MADGAALIANSAPGRGVDRNRQVREGAAGPEGEVKRRVSLVVDYAGPAQANTASL